MKWKSVFWSISFLGCLAYCSAELSCSQLRYTPTSCLEIRRPSLSASAASSDCTSDGQTGLALVEQDIEFQALRSFVEVLLEESELLWLGYMYDGSGVLRLSDGNAMSESAALMNEPNFASGESVNPEAGVCVAIGKDGQFRRRPCTEMNAYACYQDMAPSVTDFSVSPGRFLADSTMATLMCQFYPPDATVVWRFNNVAVNDARVSSSSGQSTFTINSFSSAASGSYECVVSNGLGGVVSEAISLAANPSGMDAPAPVITSVTTSPSRSDIRTGSSVNLTCNTNDTSATLQWYFNGMSIESATQMTYTINGFSEAGFYQCRASLATGENGVYTIRLDPLDPPGPDDSISASPLTRDSILVVWLPPIFSRDPLLLRYSLFYTTSNTPLNPSDYSSAQSATNLLPTLRDGSVGTDDDRVEYVLSGLEPGTEYMISVRASFMTLQASNSFYIAQSFTFGHAPVDTVEGLMVSRSKDNKSLVAQWQKLESQPPTGTILIYEIEFRNFGKDISMTTRVSSLYDQFSVLDVEDASSYEVRVRAGVQVSSDPVQYEFNEFTKWVLVDRIVATVPPPPPTLGVLPQLSGGEIAAIVVCVCVAFLVVMILIVGLIALLLKSRNGKGHEFTRGRTESASGVPLSRMSKAEEAGEKEDSPAI